MNEKALRIESKAEKCLSAITHALANSELEAACYAVRVRIKSEARLKEKVFRKQETKPEYTLESITDVIGIRLITLFRSELPLVLDKVLDLISHNIQLNPHPLKKDSLEELIVYSTEHENSAFNLRLKERLEEKGLGVDIRHSNEGYSSLHVVCRISAQTVECKSIGDSYHLPVEIQIRTVFEDAWGEIDHKYGYLARSGKDHASAPFQPLTAPHLLVLKEFTEACASYADVIKSMATPQTAMPSGAGKILSVESDLDVLRRFAELGVSRAYIDQYKKGRQVRDDCAFVGSPLAEQVPKYLQAHAYFDDIYKRAKEDASLSGDGRLLYLYYISLNSAFCLLSAGTPNSVERAIGIYNGLLQDFPEYPIVRMRLAQAQAKAGKREEALSLFENVAKMTEDIGNRSKTEGLWRDNLPLTDYNHISVTLPKLLGYSYWEKASFQTSPTDASTRLDLYRKAYETTFPALALRPGDVNLTNNLAFYAIEYLSLGVGDDFSSRLRNDLPAYSALIEKLCAEEPGASDIKILETLLQLYVFESRLAEAKLLAYRIGEILKAGGEPDGAIAHQISLRVIDILSRSSVGSAD